jgi:hypothetical protein
MSSLGLNTGGNHPLLLAQINDGSGATVTVAAAATPGIILHASLYTAAVNTTSGGIVFDGTAGTATVAKVNGAGKYIVEGIAGNAIGQNAGAFEIEIHKNGTIVGTAGRRVEPAAAVQAGVAPALAVIDLVVDDVVTAKIRVGTNGDAIVLRDFSLLMTKISD